MKSIWITSVAALLVTTLAFAAEEKKPATAEHAEESPLVVDVATQKQLGIATAPVSAQALTEELRAPGEVKANAYATTLVSPRIPAQIVRRNAKLGDTVKAGQQLVTLSSVEVAEAQGSLIVSERDWLRVKALGAEAVSAKRYTESQVARDQAYAKLRAYGVSEGEIVALTRQGSNRANGEFALVAPQAGRITTDDFVAGERVEPGKVLFTLVDESQVWVEAQLAPDAAERVTAGTAVRVIAHDQTLTGKVTQLSHRTVEASRTTPIRIEVPNEGDALHPGEFVETFIATRGTTNVLGVPSDAIVQLQGQPTVFKAEADGRFEPIPIQAGETRGTRTVIKQGLAAGDVIVVQGAYVLKARLLKSQLGEGHGD
jgi:cobalt-zinc-cadmium efflux system membrane fusion protein